MAGGAGHIYDMISRMRNNSNLLSKPGYFKMKEAYIKVLKKENLVYQEATPEELQRVRNKIIIEKRAERVRVIVVIFASLMVSAVLLSLATYGIMKYFW